MAKINKELLAIMEDYNLFMDSDKQMELPIAVTNEKPNHTSSLYLEEIIHTDQSLGNNSFDCEIRNKDIKHVTAHKYTSSNHKQWIVQIVKIFMDESQFCRNVTANNIVLEPIAAIHFCKIRYWYYLQVAWI